MKLKKKSGLMGAVIALSCASLVSVGFAAWVISQGDNQTVNGNITVDTVEDDRHLIRNASGGESFVLNYGNNSAGVAASAICFGWNDSGATSDASKIWLLNEDNSKAENLTASVDLYISNYEKTTTGITVTTALDTSDTSEEAVAARAAWAAAVSANYVVDVTNVATLTPTDDTTTSLTGYSGKEFRKFTLDIAFSWGSYFGSPAKNPYAFFNDGTKSAASDGDTASTVLKAIEAISTVSFVVTIKVAA